MAAAKRNFLTSVYALKDLEATRSLYRDWAETYDDEVRSQGYITPARCARILAEHVPDLSLPVLDLGCGTGVAGLALIEAGFSVIDGADFSEEMLELARERRIYRRTFLHDMSHPLQIESGWISHAVAVGVFNRGHAPPEAIDHALAALPTGGLLVFSLNDRAMEDPSYEGRVHAQIDGGGADLLVRDYGEHLPGAELGAMVYALRKRN